ncbi:MAG: nucleotide exchange factor GrpE [Planctomycetes bacterium]|nr:nucleotide exchange factor GrpE [Planctomycetota bacterium]MBL7146253.1 nucleotide exchange factor GrpE [Phycisphaerae bacterium]
MNPKRKEKPKSEDSQKVKNDPEELRQNLEGLQKEKDELFGKLQRVSADYANFQKRVPKQIADTICYEKEKIIKSLLPALDNFEHTLQNAHSAEDADVFIKGIQIIHDQMLDIFKSHGVEQIKSPGEKFNPAMHEAMMQKTEIEKEDNIVLEEFQKGYTLNGRIIRPSKVIVNKLTTEQPAQQKAIPEEPTADECEMEAEE